MRFLAPALLIALAFGGGSAFAEPETAARLRAELRDQLGRMFEDDEYFLDVQIQAQPNSSVTVDPLPGLAASGIGAGDPGALDPGAADLKVDVLVVVDNGVAPERVRLADEVARRIVGGAGVSKKSGIKVRQQSLTKPAPVPEVKSPVPEPKSFMEELMSHQDQLLRGLALLWAAVASLIGIIGLVRRMSHPAPRSQASRPAASSPSAPSLDGKGGEGQGVGPRSKAPTKDELYSKDQVLMSQVKDIVEECKTNPRKAAKVLTRWVGLSTENARYAAILLRNCDIATIEAMSALLHPSDIEKIMAQPVDDFDAFGDENRRVIELMRADLALLSAERVYKDRPDPLEFARALSEEDVAALVQGESMEVVAMVATQIPPHRMQKFYSTLDEPTLNELCRLISTLPPPSIEAFKVVGATLQAKASQLGSNLFDDKSRVQTLAQLLQVLSSPKKLEQTAKRLRDANEKVYREVRAKVILPSDFDSLPQRAVAVVTQAVDADLLGTALAGIGHPFSRLATMLPEAYREVFFDKLKQDGESNIQDAAWDKVAKSIQNLIASGLLSERELSSARILSDEMRKIDESVASEVRIDAA